MPPERGFELLVRWQLAIDLMLDLYLFLDCFENVDVASYAKESSKRD